MSKSFFSLLICGLVALVAVPAFADPPEAHSFRADPADQTAKALENASLYDWVMSFENPSIEPIVVEVPTSRLKSLENVQVEPGAPMDIGVHQDLDLAFASFGKAKGVAVQSLHANTVVWAASFRSPGARGVRLHLTDFNLPQGAVLFAYGPEEQVFGPYGEKGPNGNGELWTNTVTGDEIRLQLHIPRDHAFSTPRAQSTSFFRVVELAHMGDGYPFRLAAEAAEKAFCSYNDSCIRNAECENIPPGVQQVQDAIGFMIFTRSGGRTSACTGGLLNTTNNSQIPYFLTAHHCINTQSSANSLETYFRWTTPCGSSCPAQAQPPSSVPRVSGSTLLASHPSSDAALLRLSGAPAGSVFLGWTTSPVAYSGGTRLYRVSHPFAAPQGYSEHVVNTTSSTCAGSPRGNYVYSDAVLGSIQSGSSGSPVVNLGGQVVGQGYAACGPSPGTTCDGDDQVLDGAFTQSYSSFSAWLNPGGGGGGASIPSCTCGPWYCSFYPGSYGCCATC